MSGTESEPESEDPFDLEVLLSGKLAEVKSSLEDLLQQGTIPEIRYVIKKKSSTNKKRSLSFTAAKQIALKSVG